MKARLPQGMGGGAQNMNSMIKQAQKMQTKITELQEDIENREFSTTVGGGAVEVTMSGKKEIKKLVIKPEVVDPEDVEMLQDLIISAFNDTVKQIEETTETEMGAITGGADSFLSKNKARSVDAFLSRWTKVIAIGFFVLVLAANAVMYFVK